MTPLHYWGFFVTSHRLLYTQFQNTEGYQIREPLFHHPLSERGRCGGKSICHSQLQAIGIYLELEVTQNKTNPPKAFFMIHLFPLFKPTDKALHTNSQAAHSAKVISTPKPTWPWRIRNSTCIYGYLIKAQVLHLRKFLPFRKFRIP